MNFNWWTFLFEALNFVVLAYVLHRLLYRPLRDAIDKRQKENARAKVEAEQARQEAVALQQQVREQLAAAEQHRQQLIHDAHEQAESERQKLLALAEHAAQQRQDELRQALEQERQEALKSLRGEVVAEALELARRLLGEASDRTLHQQLTLRLVETLRRLPEPERERLRSDGQADEGAVLETAQELDSEALGQINEAVSTLVGKPVPLTSRTRPALIAGLRLRIGGQVWDSSLAAPLLGADHSTLQEGRP
ncbi:MAG TPA: F0F1 ATP synthase subunit delta [Gemmataceae bacterium]|nr:F0F1 ATP synthase subunit delta [Gemmataceae bacterium]